MARSSPDREKRKRARALLRLLEETENFEANLDLYVEADGQFTEDFLPILDRTREYIKSMDDPQNIEEFFSLPPNFQEAILEYCLDHGKADFVAAVMSLCTDPHMKKLVKKTAHRLQAMGVKVSRKPREAVFKPVKEESKGFSGYASTIDSMGEQIVWYSEPSAGTGIRALQVFVSDLKGVSKCEVFHPSRSGFRQFIKDIMGRDGIPIVEVGPSYARFLIDRAHRISQEKGSGHPEGFITVYKSLSKDIEIPAQTGIWDAYPREEIGSDRDLIMAGDSLHEQEGFRDWYLDTDTLLRFEINLYDRQSSKLVVDGKQAEEYIDDLIHKTVNEFFSPERRLLYAGRLIDMAYLLHLKGQTDVVRIALASALALEGDDRAPDEIPFCFRMLTKVIKRKEQKKQEEEDKDKGLIITP